MNDRENARHLLDMAEKDLRAMEGMRDPEVFATEIFGFHAQQAVEKALKAWLCVAGVRFQKTHDLGELLATLQASGQTEALRFRTLEYLTEFAVQFRYEAFEELGEELDRASVTQEIARLLQHVRGLLVSPAGSA